jgi:hypothetical protein
VKNPAGCLLSVFLQGSSSAPPAQSRQRRLLISVHVPKTAGTTFRFVLKSLYRESLLFDYGPYAPLTSGPIQKTYYAGPVPDRGEFLREACQRGKVRCIHGHFPASKYYAVFPEADFIFWSRDPVERVVSEFFHCRRNLDPHNPLSRAVYEGYVNIWEYAKRDQARNVQSRMVHGVPWEKFSFVGVCERFKESIEDFAHRTRTKIDARRVKERNRNDTKPMLKDPKLWEYILDLNRDDRRLHEMALSRHGAPARNAGVRE